MAEDRTVARSEEPDELIHAALRVLRFAIVLTGDEATAEDVTQTAVARLLPLRPTVRNEEAYLRQTVVNIVRDRHRRKRLLQFVSDAEMPDHPDAGSMASETATRLDLQKVLSNLPVSLRAVVVLRFLDDLPVRDVAQILGRPAGSIRRMTYEALQLIREDQQYPFGLGGNRREY